jgi:hypothetical protein
MQYLRLKYGHLNELERKERIAELILKNEQRLNGSNSHFYSRHGAQTEMYERRIRAYSGLAPDGIWRNPVNSSRFISHQDQLEAYRMAKALYSPGNRVTSFNMNRTIGEGFKKMSDTIFTTSKVQVYYDATGKIIPIFPIQ